MLRHQTIWFSAIALLIMATPSIAQYHTHAEIGTELLAAETNYPTLCRRYVLGNSELGRELWAVCISDNVGVQEDEPEFRYVSTMHGDEITGVELCLSLVDHLLSNYGSDPDITNLVDEVEIWIVPLMNPDGYENGSRTRFNSNGVDLNRDFPDPFTSPSNTTVGRAAETAVIMNWSFGQSFVLAANLHGGALVANYPLDTLPDGSSGSGVYSASPDDDVFIFISEEYSQFNLPMWNSSSFFHGITNGAEWYTAYGGLQDWSYHYLGCNELTLEVSNTKQPPSSQIPTFWNENRDSMLAYLETCLIGARGIVTGDDTGLPLDATLAVVGRDHDVFTDPDIGDYHRMLLPGLYDLTFAAQGYETMTQYSVAVNLGDATRVDIALPRPAAVAWPNGGEILAVGSPVLIDFTGASSAQFHVQYTDSASASSSTTDDFEAVFLGPEYVTGGDANWSVTTGDAYTGVRSARSGNTSDNQTTWMSRDVSGGALSFWYRVSSEATYDWFDFYIDDVRMLHLSGEVPWSEYTDTLAAGTHTLRWEYVKDVSVSNGSDQVWIDDLSVVDSGATWVDITALTPIGATNTSWAPPSEGVDYKVRVRAFYGNGDYGQWDDSDTVFEVAGIGATGDFDQDGDVDLADGAEFNTCFGTSVSVECATVFDFDGSNDVDLNDYQTFFLLMGPPS